jgi:uncharacterized membrane protein YsdA (DUF1294 family)
MDPTAATALAAYGLMSIVAFVLHWVDKRRAMRGEWRIREATLHLVELLGGWPGSFLAQRVLRHKWRKTSYVVTFWTIVAVHVAMWTWWLA